MNRQGTTEHEDTGGPKARSATPKPTPISPSLKNGYYDHSQIDRIINQIIDNGVLEEEKHLIIGCTTMPGYCDTIIKLDPFCKLCADKKIISKVPSGR